MKNKIIILVSYMHDFLFLKDSIRELLKNKKYALIVVSVSEDISNTIKDFFPNINVHIGYDIEFISRTKPNIVICTQIWYGEIQSFLKKLKEKNIPIVMYDHGTLMFRNRYEMSQDEKISHYRVNLSLCSHVVCWGKEGRDYWEGFGVLKEKLFVIGAIQYDYLYKKKINEKNIYNKLNIDNDKKIILFFSDIYHPGAYEKVRRNRNINILNSLKKFVKKNDEYVLIVKPHPASMIFNKKSHKYLKDILLIANPGEEAWDENNIIDTNEVVAVSYAIVSPWSTVLVSPLILKTPIIYIENDKDDASVELGKLGKKVFFVLKRNMQIGNIIKNIEKEYSYERKKESEIYAERVNYKNDGCAVKRFVGLISIILKEKKEGKVFYMTEEEELVECIRRFPNIPYCYQYLIRYYARNKDFKNSEKWFDEYAKRFKSLDLLFASIVKCSFSRERKPEEIKLFLSKYYRMNLLDLNLIYKFALVNRMCGDYKLSIFLYDKLLKKSLNKELKKNVLYEKGLAYLLHGSFKKAIDNFKSSLKIILKKKDIKDRIYFRLGQAYLKKKEYKNAKIYLEKCLNIMPEHNSAKQLLDIL